MASRENNLKLAQEAVDALRKIGCFITTVESCTGGGLAYYITNISGASEVMKDAFVTYSNAAKIALGVPKETIDLHTVYSPETALAMARAGLAHSVQADISVGITGSISRVDPVNPNSKPGVIYIAVVHGGKSLSRTLEIHATERIDVKDEIIESSLKLVLKALVR